jgi:aromatic-L-amino-acid decarboxylase
MAAHQDHESGDTEAFRRDAHRLVDWIADYLANTERYPVLTPFAPGHVRESLPAHPPESPEPFEAVLKDVEEIIAPGLTHWNHPGFLAYFASSASGPGILGDILSSAFNINAMLWRTAPSATELEEVVMDWLRQLLGLPPEFMGVINDGASVSNLCGIAAAREALDLGIREEGMARRRHVPRLRLYASQEAHSSIDKATMVLGLGRAGVRKVAADNDFRMRPDALETAIEDDQKSGWKPFCVVATVGTTSSASVDPVPQVADICRRHRLWLHVDAAYAGSAAILPEMRWALDGVEQADSFVANPHKWLFVPIDFSAFYCRHPDVLRRTFSLVPEYLRTPDDDRARNLMDYGVALGRRFRALKLWMVIRAFGAEGLRQRLRDHIALAKRFHEWMAANADFEFLAPQAFSIVCFRARPHNLPDGPVTDDYLNVLNQRLLDAVNATGDIYLSHTALNERFTLRLAIGHVRTTEVHVRRAWDLLREHAVRLDAELRPPNLRAEEEA